MATWYDLGINLPSGASGEVRTLCPECSGKRQPAHQRIRDLAVNVEKGTWHCHHCGWSGGLETTDWRERKPLYAPPRPLPSVTAPTLWDDIVAWFADRGIPESVLIEKGITASREFCPVCEDSTPTVLFPYYVNGQHINTKHRCSAKHFRMEKGAQRVLYNQDACADSTTVVIVEGEIDALSVHVAGIPHVVSVPDGAPAPNANNYSSKFSFLEAAESLFERATQVIIATDADEPGQKLMDELARRIGPEKCSRVIWPEGIKDANDCLQTYGPDVLRVYLDDAAPFPVEGIYTGFDLASDLERLYEFGDEIGIGFDIPDLSQHYRVKTGYMSIVTGIPGHGKALSLDTPILTTTGFKLMADVQPGDTVYDERGEPCSVVAAWEWDDRPCYEVQFSDGTVIVADAEHEWLTRSDKARRSALQAAKKRGERHDLLPRGSDQRYKRTYPSVVTTVEIADTLTAEGGKRKNHAVQVAGALRSSTHVPAPYTVGAWLGDGHSNSSRISGIDEQVFDNIAAEGWAVGPDTPERSRTVYGLCTFLRKIGVFQNKHIPQAYLLSCEDDRRALLAGLLDTDGSVTTYGRVEFCSTNRMLAEGVRFLALSLGWIAVLTEDRATLNGRDISARYRVTWTPDRSPFRLDRKSERCKAVTRDTNRWRYIVRCDEVENRRTKCIEVDSPSHLFLCGEALIPTHNSSVIDQLLMWLAEQHDWTFALFSPEQQPLVKHQQHLIEQHVGKPFNRGWNERMTREEMAEGNRWVADRFAFILPESPAVETILNLAKVQVFRNGVKGVVIDPWNELEHSRPRHQSETEYISDALSQFRRFARNHDVHIWLIAHPTKMRATDSGKEPIPGLWDISGSAHFRNKADIGLTVWRDLEKNDNTVELHVTKMRFTTEGKLGKVTFGYDAPTKRLFWIDRKGE